MTEGTKESCFCEKCKSACHYKPGWFLPGQAEEVAAYLGISLEDLFRTKLAVDWWEGVQEDEDHIFLVSPAIATENTGVEFPGDPCGPCIFFKKDRCEIHTVKPFECREMIHDKEPDGCHGRIADAWKSNQAQIVELLRRKPEAVAFSNSIFNMFGFR